MHILLLHNTYQQAGGEDTTLENEKTLLRQHGHDVSVFTVSNDSIRGLWRKVATAWFTARSPWGKKQAGKAIEKYKPDLVHIHNFFPLLSPSVYEACRQAGIPVVQSLHNYRTVCAGTFLMRDGNLCEDCIHGTPYQAVLNRCYRNSRMGSLAVAHMVAHNRKRGTWQTQVDRFVAMTQFGKKKFVESGFPPHKISVKPHFVNAVESSGDAVRSPVSALYVGRLSPEKGIHTLLKAWKNLPVPLRIVGDGPLMESVKKNASEFIAVAGSKPPGQIAGEMSRASFLIFPSEWHEIFGLTIIEAYSQGLPVIASNLGAMQEIVEDRVTGLHFRPGDAEALREKVRWACEHPEEMGRMGKNARRAYEDKYTAEINYNQLMKIYGEAIEENQGRNP